jgi:GTPase Era involved in 16S rRNA processing
MLQAYASIRNDLLKEIEHEEIFFSNINDNDTVNRLEEIKNKLLANKFHLVVLGQFKRGKSTFINSIIGDKILPTSVIPLTSIVTVLTYGQKELIKVIFEQGDVKEIKREELKDWVTEEGNPGNKKGVKEVEIQYPSEYLRNGICLIDTPGVGSIFEDNTQMTYKYLPKIDAAIFLASADPPISQAELEFLKDVIKHVKDVFFVLNKIDYLNEEELKASLDFTKQAIEKELGIREVRIYPISAKIALEGKIKNNIELLKKSGLEEFNKVLNDFLLKKKGQIILKRSIESIRNYLSEKEFSLKLEEKAISAPLAILEEKINKFNEKMEEIRQEKEDTYYYFEGEIKRVIDVLDRDLMRIKEKEVKKLDEYVDKLAEQIKEKSTDAYIKAIEKAVDEDIVKTFNDWINTEEIKLNKEYARVSKKMSEKTNEIIDTILHLSEQLFEIKIEKIKIDEQIEKESSFYYMLGEAPKFFGVDSAFDFFSKKLLPFRFSKKFALKDLKKKIPEKVDKTCGRLRWDFMDRIRRSFMNFRWDLNQKIEATEQDIKRAIEKALELRKKSKKEIEDAKKDIHYQLEKIQKAKSTLQKLNDRI